MTTPGISQSRLDRYSDFVSLHSRDGVYDPESGMEGLLSVVTPDIKGIVLYSMENGEPVFNSWQLHLSTLEWLERNGVNRILFPITYMSAWNYCERPDNEGNIVSGSLVDVGAAVREVYEDTQEGLKVGYHISIAGKELALPTISNAVEFVDRARKSDVPHKYDSMGRIFGGVQSATENRKQLAVYNVVKFLVDNPSAHRFVDIVSGLDGAVNRHTVSNVLRSLGYAGIIGYKSVSHDVQGRRERGWSRYSYTGKPIDLEQVIQIRPDLHGPPVSKVVQFIHANPDLKYERNYVSDWLKLNEFTVSRILSALAKLGLLIKESEFSSAELQSIAEKNDLTKMLYEIILEPAWQSASTLQSASTRHPAPEKLRTLSVNYQEERSRTGVRGGEEVRDSIMQVLESGEPVKLSYIAYQVNKHIARNLHSNGIRHQIKSLIKQGAVEKTAKGFYRKR